MMKAVAYSRKSTSGTDENGVERQEGSFARQKAAICDYARRKGIDIVKWYEEPVSGKSIRKRKVFLQMIRDAKAPGCTFKAIIFGEYDRFMRDVKEAMRYEVDLDDAGVELHFTNLQNDGSVGDQIYKSVAREMAAEYSRELARKVVQGMVRKAKMGSWLGGTAPYGYRKEKDANGNIRLLINGEEAKIVREIFKMSLKGHGHKRIAVLLNEKGIPAGEVARGRKSLINRNPDGRWSGPTVRMMLRNPVYKGLFRWNKRARVDCFDWKLQGQGTVDIGKIRTQSEAFKKNGSFYSDRDKPKEDWIVKENTVPAIIEPEIFDEVQAKFRPYSRRLWRRPNNIKYLMSGALRCAKCENNFFGHRYSKILKGTSQRAYYEYYRCGGDVRKGSHNGVAKPMVRREAVDAVVMDGITDRIGRFADPGKVEILFRNRIKNLMESRPNRLSNVESEIRKIEREKDRLIEIYVKFEKAVPEDKVYQLNAKKTELENEREALIAAGERNLSFDLDQEVASFLRGIKDARRLIDSALPADRIRAREMFLDGAEVQWDSARGKPTVDFGWRKVPKVCSVDNRTPPPAIIRKLSS